MDIPKFQLTRVYSDGSADTPQLHALNGIDTSCRMGRRGFLLTSAFGTSAAASLLGCNLTLGPEPCLRPRNFEQMRANLKQWRLDSLPSPQAILTDPTEELAAHLGRVASLSFSRDGKLLVSVCNLSEPRRKELAVKIWSVETGALIQKFEGRGDNWMHAVFRPDADGLIVSDNAELLMLRPVDPVKHEIAGQVVSLGAKQKFFHRLLISQDGRKVATVVDGAVVMRSMPDGAVVSEIECWGTEFALSPDGSLVAVADDRCVTLTVYDSSSGTQLRTWDANLSSLAFCADGTMLLGRGAGGIYGWNGNTGEFVKGLELASSKSVIDSVLVASANGKRMAASFRDEERTSMMVLEGPFGPALWHLRSNESYGTAAAFSADGRFLAVGSDSGSVIIWDLDAGKLLHKLVDVAVVEKGVELRQINAQGKLQYFRGKCGDPLPEGAVCICNCVPGTYEEAPPPLRPIVPGGSYTYCQCDQVCTCVPIYGPMR